MERGLRRQRAIQSRKECLVDASVRDNLVSLKREASCEI
jgi:hypothetical protein